jgi:uncharacterized protein (DUF1810 family)
VRLTHTEDPHDLDRFVRAQAPEYERALAEIRAGRKHSHWIWFVFPQIEGLGSSSMSKRYAIRSRAEAQAYLSHSVLGARLRACCEALLALEHRSALEIFGSPDDLKVRSSATLFACVSEPGSIFERVIEKYFGGRRDPETLRLLERAVVGPERGIS